MLEIKNLHAKVGDKEILKGIDLVIRDGEIHALMGTNGAGKSTLSNVIVGNPAYEVTEGSITFNGQDLLAMSTEERAHAGIFMSFQAPIEIPGVSMTNFLRAAVNARRVALGKEPLKSTDFLKVMREKRKLVEIKKITYLLLKIIIINIYYQEKLIFQCIIIAELIKDMKIL